MANEEKHLVPTALDTILAVMIGTACVVAFLCSGHAGVILILAICSSLWILLDLMKVWNAWVAKKDCEVLVSNGQLPLRPKLPVQWFALSLVLQSSGLLCQLLFGWTVISGGLLFFYYGGCEFACHLFFYSGTVVENSSTTLPTLAMAGLTLFFVFSGSGTSYGYMDLGRWGGLFWVLLSGVVGIAFGKVFLDYLEVKKGEELTRLVKPPGEAKAQP